MSSSISSNSFFSGSASSSRRSSSSSRPPMRTITASSTSNASAVREPLSSSSLRNRENIIVSNREIRQLFDSIKELGDTVKRQNEKIERMAARLDGTSKDVVELKTVLNESISSNKEKENDHSGPIPNGLKHDVHLLHNKQEVAHQFRGSEGIDSAHNSKIRSFLCQELQKESINNHSKSIIKRAVTRYYETKRQQFLDSLPHRKDAAEKRVLERKLTSRRRRLFVKRMRVATDSEKEVLHELDANFMSDEEDGEDDQSGLWIVRSPAWRSRRLTSLINSLQQRVEAKSTSSHPSNPRVQGEPSTRQPPSSSPTWAVQIIREPEASPEIPEDPPSPQPPSPYFSPRRGNDNDGDDDGEDGWVRTPMSRRRHRQLLD